MPISHHRMVPLVMDQVVKIDNVKSVLDIGCGFGRYGVLLRERLDVRYKRYSVRQWKTRIDAVEVWKLYLTPLHSFIYDNIYVKNIFSYCNKLDNYDVILMLECLEHLPKWKGKKVVKRLEEKANKLLLISFPDKFNGKENAEWENPYEEHKCLWTKGELSDCIGPVKQLSPTIFAKVKV